MTDPFSTYDMPDTDRKEYLAARTRIRRANDYILVEPDVSRKISYAWSKAERHYEGTGNPMVFQSCADWVERVYLTQTF